MKMNRPIALAKADLKLSLRRGEALILNLLFPIFFLVAINRTSDNIDKALAFSFVLTTMSTSMSSLGIMTGFDRRFRVLVRLGTTPLTKLELVISKVLSVLLLQTVYFLVLCLVALTLGWEPSFSWLLAPIFCWIASFSFAGMALLIAGQVKAEANLALQNLLYFLMAGVGSVVLSDSAPSSLLTFVKLFPSGALHFALQSLVDIRNFSIFSILVLLVGAVFWSFLAARFFSFDES